MTFLKVCQNFSCSSVSLEPKKRIQHLIFNYCTFLKKGIQQLRWDDEDDELPAASPIDDTSPEDQSSYYLNMTSNKTDDGETIPLVVSEKQLIQDSFPLFKPVPSDAVHEEYLAPIMST